MRSPRSTSRSRSPTGRRRVLLKNPSLFLPPMLFPLMNFLAFAGGLSRLRHVPGFEFEGGYTAFQFVFVLLQSAAFGGVFAGFGIARDFERGFAKRLLVSAPQRGGIILGYALASLMRWAMIAIVLTIVALLAGMQVGGNGVDLFGLYGARDHLQPDRPAVGLRRRDALPLGPGRAADADAGLHAALPRAGLRAARLLQGWIHGVARFNPLTFLLEAGPRLHRRATRPRSLAAFSTRRGLLARLRRSGRALGLRSAERAGSTSRRGRRRRPGRGDALAAHHLAAVRVVADRRVALDGVDRRRRCGGSRCRRGRARRRPSRRPRCRPASAAPVATRPSRAARPTSVGTYATPRGVHRRRASRGRGRRRRRRRSSTRRRSRTRARRPRRTSARTSSGSSPAGAPSRQRAAVLCEPPTLRCRDVAALMRPHRRADELTTSR